MNNTLGYKRLLCYLGSSVTGKVLYSKHVQGSKRDASTRDLSVFDSIQQMSTLSILIAIITSTVRHRTHRPEICLTYT